jgi:hypothetical protein
MLQVTRSSLCLCVLTEDLCCSLITDPHETAPPSFFAAKDTDNNTHKTTRNNACISIKGITLYIIVSPQHNNNGMPRVIR